MIERVVGWATVLVYVAALALCAGVFVLAVGAAACLDFIGTVAFGTPQNH